MFIIEIGSFSMSRQCVSLLCDMRLKIRSPVVFVSFVVFCCLILLAINIYELQWMKTEHIRYHHNDKAKIQETSATVTNAPVFLAYGKNVDSGHLKHVFEMFQHFGYIRGSLELSDHWDVLWAHDYPFRKLSTKLKNLKSHQMVNHFPGSGFITNKMDLAVSNIPHIPRAFKIPQQTQELLDYASTIKKFVQKSNDHRGIKIETVETLNLKANGSFLQEYIDKPFLVDGYKFDIGVYTIITSIDPLRVYIYNGDILFRYCPEKYHPFDPKNLNKYVIGDDYLPTWEVPSLKKLYTELGYSMRDSFNAYVRSLGKDPSKIWLQVEEAIRAVCLAKESAISKVLSTLPSHRNFFEMVRFDFVVDENLNVFIMEANMSPNLSSAHFLPNQLLYEQVLFNLFNLVGLASKINITKAEVATKNVAVSAAECTSAVCVGCMAPQCQLCLPCLTPDTLDTLYRAYREHTSRHDCHRIFPPPMTQESAETTEVSDLLSPENQLMVRWFQAKCKQDSSWC
ncbi:probable tubulin polyglutamylase ttll-15 [Homalodisca vitripennis]|uniref:probable tubulin polyglutamylase ttll-15 n=1 Tax=Homalodisca vitripennis TaxID=197043 RepID=UPI001EECB3E6|nr:probable tubulin polyglutamylase ttll-15 [Homalodisca vitripennis]